MTERVAMTALNDFHHPAVLNDAPRVHVDDHTVAPGDGFSTTPEHADELVSSGFAVRGSASAEAVAEAVRREQEEAARREQEEAARREQEEAARREQEEAARREQEEAARREQEEAARKAAVAASNKRAAAHENKGG